MDFVVAGRVKPSQIRRVGGRPVLQIGPSVPRKALLTVLGGNLGVQGVHVVVQGGRDLTRWAGASVVLDEKSPEEGQDQRGIAGTKQPPSRVALPQ